MNLPPPDIPQSHLFCGYCHVLTYPGVVQIGGNNIQTRLKISNASCMTAACHGKPDDQFKTKKIKFTGNEPNARESP